MYAPSPPAFILSRTAIQPTRTIIQQPSIFPTEQPTRRTKLTKSTGTQSTKLFIEERTRIVRVEETTRSGSSEGRHPERCAEGRVV